MHRYAGLVMSFACCASGCTVQSAWRTTLAHVRQFVDGPTPWVGESVILAYRGRGDRGGTPLGATPYHSIYRIDVATGTVEQIAELRGPVDARVVGTIPHHNTLALDCLGEIRAGSNPMRANPKDIISLPPGQWSTIRWFPQPLLCERSDARLGELLVVDFDARLSKPHAVHLDKPARRIIAASSVLVFEHDDTLDAYRDDGTKLWSVPRARDERLALAQTDRGANQANISRRALVTVCTEVRSRGSPELADVGVYELSARSLVNGDVLWRQALPRDSMIATAFEAHGCIVATGLRTGTDQSFWTVWSMDGATVVDTLVKSGSGVSTVVDWGDEVVVVGTPEHLSLIREQRFVRELSPGGTPVGVKRGVLLTYNDDDLLDGHALGL